MAWYTPPTFTVGEILTAALLNELSTDLTALQTFLPTYGVGTAASGTAPAAGTPVLALQAGNTTYSQSTAGAAQTVTLPTAFPNGIMGVWVTSLVYEDAYSVLSLTASSFAVRGFNNNDAGVTTGTFCWLAIGF